MIKEKIKNLNILERQKIDCSIEKIDIEEEIKNGFNKKNNDEILNKIDAYKKNYEKENKIKKDEINLKSDIALCINKILNDFYCEKFEDNQIIQDIRNNNLILELLEIIEKNFYNSYIKIEKVEEK